MALTFRARRGALCCGLILGQNADQYIYILCMPALYMRSTESAGRSQQEIAPENERGNTFEHRTVESLKLKEKKGKFCFLHVKCCDILEKKNMSNAVDNNGHHQVLENGKKNGLFLFPFVFFLFHEHECLG